MVTVTITIKPYLTRYMYVRYAQSLEPESESRPSPSSSASLRKPIPIHLSHITPIYHFLYQLSVPHPSKVSWKETGNITFVCLIQPTERIRKYIIISGRKAH